MKKEPKTFFPPEKCAKSLGSWRQPGGRKAEFPVRRPAPPAPTPCARPGPGPRRGGRAAFFQIRFAGGERDGINPQIFTLNRLVSVEISNKDSLGGLQKPKPRFFSLPDLAL